MSIIAQDDHGYFICSKKYFNDIYKNCVINPDPLIVCNLKIQEEFFTIKTPFVMTSAAMRMAKNHPVKKLSKKKQKKKSAIDDSSIPAYVQLIRLALSTLKDKVWPLNYLDKFDVTSEDWFENNIHSREAAKKVPNFEIDIEKVNQRITECVIENKADDPVVAIFQGQKYVIPAHAKAHVSNVCNLDYFEENQYDLIVIDPPWQNKSAKRKKWYKIMNSELLMQLPIEKIGRTGCIVAVWVTNNNSQLSFVKEELFKKWRISNWVMWHWAKITQKGHFVTDIDSPHKKPYENLLIGCINHSSNEETSTNSWEIRNHQTIISIPSSIHSHKPPLVEILKPFLPEKPNCLEIFARYLLPGWTSIGNEVLKLQHIDLFEIGKNFTKEDIV